MRISIILPSAINGSMAERSKAPVLKTGVGESLPWVRILLLPPNYKDSDMTELDYHKLFLDWLGHRGKVTEQDIADFDQWLRHYSEAKKMADEMINRKD